MTTKSTTPVTVRPPGAVHVGTSALADADYISVNTALVQAAELWTTRRACSRIVTHAVDDVMARRRALLEQLRDA